MPFRFRIIAACALGLLLMGLAMRERPAVVDDFRAFYRGAQLAGSGQSIYSDPALAPDTGKEGNWLPWVRLPHYGLILKPLTLVPYPLARTLWLMILALAFGLSLWLFPGPRARLALAFCYSIPVAYTFALGQDVPLVLLITLTAAMLYRRGTESGAGIVASLLAIKITYLIPVAIVIMARSRRAFAGLLSGVLVQFSVCFAIEGTRWPVEYLNVLRNPLFDVEPRRMLNIRGLVTSLGLPQALFVIGSAAILIWLWIIARRIRLDDALILALPAGMIASPHCYVYDAVVLYPLAVPLASTGSWQRMMALGLLTPLPYIALLSQSERLVLAGGAFIVAAVIVSIRARIPDSDTFSS